MEKHSFGRGLLVFILIFFLFGIVSELYLSNWLEKFPWTNAKVHIAPNKPKLIFFPEERVETDNLRMSKKKFSSISKKVRQYHFQHKHVGDSKIQDISNITKKVPIPLPSPLEGKKQKAPGWCTMADYRSEYWENYGELTKDGDHQLLQKMEMSFPNACVKDGILHVYKDSPDVWKLDDTHDLWLVSTMVKDGGVRTIPWSEVLFPYINVSDEDMSKWGLPMDRADALVSISNYVDYLAEFFKNGIVYLWALFKHGVITEDMWFVPLFPDPPGSPPGNLPAFIEAWIRPFTKRCLMRFSTWLQHDRCYPRVHIRQWTSRNWTYNYPWGSFREDYLTVATKTLEYYKINVDERPKNKIKIGIIKRSGLRQVLNHDEIVEKCNKEIEVSGGRTVECVSLAIEITDVAAMALFRTLHILVGVHGAGLLNGIFLNKGSGVLELFPVKVAPWNLDIYPNDLKIRDSPRLHYEGLHICDIDLTVEGEYNRDRRWQTTSQIFPWQHVRRRLQNVVNHLGDLKYPIILESVSGKTESEACELGTTVSYTRQQYKRRAEGIQLSNNYLGLPEGSKWTVKIMKADQR